MSVRVSCPYCNTAFSIAAVPASGRTPCPRCGEPAPVKASSGSVPILPFPQLSANGTPSGEFAQPESPDAARPLVPLAWIGSVVGLIVLGIVLAAIFRSEKAPPPPTAGKSSATFPPTAVPGLAYLPASVNVVAAVQPGALREYADRTGTDPKALLATAGVPEALRTALDRLGLPPDQIAHAALGLEVSDDNPIPRAVLVLAVLPPADETELLKAWKASRNPDAPDRYRVDLGGLPVDLTSPTNGVFVFATRPADLDGLPAKANRGSGHLSGDVRNAMAKLSPASVAWAVTGAGKWADKPAVKIGAELAKRPDVPALLAGVAQAAAGVSLEPDPKLTAAIRGEPAALPDIRKRLASALGDDATIAGDGDWVTVELAK